MRYYDSVILMGMNKWLSSSIGRRDRIKYN